MGEYLGINVLDGVNCSVPNGEWYDVGMFIEVGRRRFPSDDKYYEFLKSRVESPTEERGGKLRTLLECVKGMRSVPLHLLKGLKLDLGGASVNCQLPPGHALKGTPTNVPLGSVSDLENINTVGAYKNTIDMAIKCLIGNCVAYKMEMFQLLRNNGGVCINAGPTITGDQRKVAGQDKLPYLVGFSTFLPNDNIKDNVKIKVRFAHTDYKKGGCTQHIEVLSGLLFESGNVYAGNFGAAASDNLEAQVTLDNTRRVARIASAGHKITQNDWRNLMLAVFGSDVDLGSFYFTANYLKVWKSFNHSVASDKINVTYGSEGYNK
jgi:hypothetical protein